MRSIRRHLLLRAAVVGLHLASLSIVAQDIKEGSDASKASTSPRDAAGAGAPIHLVVFSDFQCPYSAAMYQNIQQLSSVYGKRLRVVWKQTPLPIHPGSGLAHRAALAAGLQGKFDAMATILYANQEHQSKAELFSYAAYLHLDSKRFAHDLDSPELAAELDTDATEAEALGIDSTPTSYLDGKRLVGIQSAVTLTTLIDVLTNAKSSPAPAAADAQNISPELMKSMAAGKTTRGDSSAPITLVEFTDFQCPFCRASTEPLRALLAARGRQVRVVYRAFPLDFHPNANLAAEAAFAAGAQGKFWEMHDLLFANQQALSAEDLDRYAQQVGLNMAVFRTAMTTHRFAGQVAADRALGTRAGVTGTPAFLIDGQLLEGSLSLPQLTAWVDTHANPGTKTTSLAPLSGLATAPTDIVIAGPSSSASVTLTWFADVRSPSAVSQAILIRDLVARGTEHVRLVYKPFPSTTHPDGNVTAAALVAAQRMGKFWEMYDALTSRHDELNENKLIPIAISLGLAPSKFAEALQAARSEVDATIEEAGQRGISGAPVLFINTDRIDGLQRRELYTEIIDRQLKSSAMTSREISGVGASHAK